MTAPGAPPGQGWSRATTLLLAVAWLLGGLAASLLVLHGILMVLYPLQMDYGEGAVLQLVDEMARGGAIYRDPQRYPWLVCQYGPLYLWLASVAQGLLGVGYGAGRLISLLSATGCVTIVFAAASLRGGRRAGLCAGTVMACSPLVVQWASMYRVDLLGLLLELAALYTVDRFLVRDEAAPSPPRGHDAAFHLLAAVLFTLALFVKQTFVFGLAASTYALMRTRGTRALLLPAAVLALACVPYALLDRAAEGRLFDLLFRFNALPWKAETALLWVSEYAHVVAAFVLLAGAHLVTERPWPRSPWVAYLLLTLLTLVGVGRIGAYYNHFLPFQAALAVVTGVVVGGAHGTSLLRRGPLSALSAAVFLVGVGLAFTLPLRPTMDPLTSYLSADVMLVAQGRLGSALDRAHARVRQYDEVLTRYPGPVVAENLGPPVLVGRAPVMCDPVTLFVLGDLGLWDPRPFEEMVRRRAFGVILLQRLDATNLRFPAPVVRLILENYKPTEQVGSDWVLLPDRSR